MVEIISNIRPRVTISPIFVSPASYAIPDISVKGSLIFYVVICETYVSRVLYWCYQEQEV
jgi:hypothetical protein